jgi:hypothetical protein
VGDEQGRDVVILKGSGQALLAFLKDGCHDRQGRWLEKK